MADCTLTGAVKGYDGTAIRPGTQLHVHRALPGSGSTTIFGTHKATHTLKADGTWDPLIKIERGAIVYISMEAPGFDLDMKRGTPLQIPNTSTATLASLPAAVSLPSQVPVLFPTKRLVILPEPAYDLAGNVVAVGILVPIDTDLSIPSNKQLDLIRLTKTDGGYIVVTMAANSQFSGLAFSLQADSDSHASSNLHGSFGSVSNKGPGSVKGVYGRAISEVGSTGVANAGVFSVQARAGATNWILELTGTDHTDAVAYIYPDNAETADLNDGIVFDPAVRMEADGAFFKAFATEGHDGDFAIYGDQEGNLLFKVDKGGHVLVPDGDETIPAIARASEPSVGFGFVDSGASTQIRIYAFGETLAKFQADGTITLGQAQFFLSNPIMTIGSVSLDANTADRFVITDGGANRRDLSLRSLNSSTKTPTSSADSSGQIGDWAWDANFIYVKTGSGWKRAALSTF